MPIGIVACAFTLFRDNLCRNSCIWEINSVCTLLIRAAHAWSVYVSVMMILIVRWRKQSDKVHRHILVPFGNKTVALVKANRIVYHTTKKIIDVHGWLDIRENYRLIEANTLKIVQKRSFNNWFILIRCF